MIILSLMGLGLQKLRWSRRKDVAGSRSKASRRSHPFDWVYRIYQRGLKRPIVLRAVPTPSEPGRALHDTALVLRLLQQDVQAFEELYDRHSRVVYSLVLRILQNAATAEEVVQDVFLQLWRNAAQYDGSRGPFVPWLLTLARNRALDHLRLKGERQRRREDQAEEFPPTRVTTDFEGSLDEKRRAARVRELIGTLQPQQRRAIELAYFEGLSHSEIASTMNEPLGTVKSWIRNAIVRLREGLQAAS